MSPALCFTWLVSFCICNFFFNVLCCGEYVSFGPQLTQHKGNTEWGVLSVVIVSVNIQVVDDVNTSTSSTAL